MDAFLIFKKISITCVSINTYFGKRESRGEGEREKERRRKERREKKKGREREGERNEKMMMKC